MASRNSFADLDSDDSDNDTNPASAAAAPAIEGAGKPNAFEVKAAPALKPQWARGGGTYSPVRTVNKAADIKKEFSQFGQPLGGSPSSRSTAGASKVIRYSQEDILALYKDAPHPNSMKIVPKVTLEKSLAPVVLKPVVYEELNQIWGGHLAKRGGGRNRNQNDRRGGHDRAGFGARGSAEPTRNAGVASGLPRGSGDVRGKGRWERLGGGRSGSDPSSQNNGGGRWGGVRSGGDNSGKGAGWERGVKVKPNRGNRNDSNNNDTFGAGMLGALEGDGEGSLEGFAAQSAKFEKEMAALRKNAGPALKLTVDSKGDKFGGALEAPNVSQTQNPPVTSVNAQSLEKEMQQMQMQIQRQERAKQEDAARRQQQHQEMQRQQQMQVQQQQQAWLRQQQQADQQQRIQAQQAQQAQQAMLRQQQMQRAQYQQQQQQQQAMLRQQQQPRAPQMSQVPPQYENEWYYQDPQGRVQGPFNSEDMRDWFDNGYFKPNLPVRQGPSDQFPFVPLARLYPDLRRAFEGRPMYPSRQGQQQQRPVQAQQQQRPGQQQQIQRQQQQAQQRTAYAAQQQKLAMQQQQQRMAEEAEKLEQQERARRREEQRKRLQAEAEFAKRQEMERRRQQEDLARQEMEKQRKAAEAQVAAKRRAEEEEGRRRKEEEQRRLLEAQKAAQAKANAWGDKSKPSGAGQKKSLLEIQSEEQKRRANDPGPNPSSQGRNPGTWAVNNKTAPRKKTMLEIQMEEAAAAGKRAAQRHAQTAPVGNNNASVPERQQHQQQRGSGVWGGNAPAPRKKSMEEIQQEEARRTQAQQGVRHGGTAARSGGLSMAQKLAQKHGSVGGASSNLNFVNVADSPASGSPEEMTTQLKQLLGVQSPGRPARRAVAGGAWAGGSQPKASKNLAQIQSEEAGARREPTSAGWQQQRGGALAGKKNTAAANQMLWGNNDNQSGKPAQTDGFSAGSELDGDMRAWATQQMNKIKGTSDLTLVSFCMTLSDNAAIREYIRDVMGTTPQTSAFASEFIRRKNSMRSKKRGKRR